MLQRPILFGLIAILWSLLVPAFGGEQKEDWTKGEFKKLTGRWTTVRQERRGDGVTQIRRISVDITESRLKVAIANEKSPTVWTDEVKVLGLEKIGNRYSPTNLLKLDRVDFAYDLVGENLVIVGRIGYRPFEGFSFSGEYQRSEKAK